ncbi:hypothetical protein BGZ54_009485 [Gamsiella multidivaricata]|nr:hypothetical protein BGZ54_009485 [Gamsiella multidivaricata]
MKFISALAVAATAIAVSSAQSIQISNPITGSQWTAGNTEFLQWSGNCASMGNSSHAVPVELVDGPSTAVRFVAALGTIDCSGNTTRANIAVPTTVSSGVYSIRVVTTPQTSYSTTFQINNPTSAPASTTAAPPAAADKPSSASSLLAGSLFALTGAAAAALQFAL